jgi:cell division protein FtsW (lipid II flippase)
MGSIDLTFVLVLLILLGLGIVMMFSASYAIAINEEKDGYFYALRQIIFAGGGLLADSTEQQEWQETEAKMQTMRNLIYVQQ